jgi:hypothetical protein
MLVATAIDHYRTYKARPFKRDERDKVTILYGGLTWKHERIVQGVFHNLQYKAEPLPNIARADLDAGPTWMLARSSSTSALAVPRSSRRAAS